MLQNLTTLIDMIDDTDLFMRLYSSWSCYSYHLKAFFFAIGIHYYFVLIAWQERAQSDYIRRNQGRRNVFSFGGGKDKKGHCNVKKGTNGVHADNDH